MSGARLARADDLEPIWRIHMAPSVLPYLGHDAMDLARFRPLFEAWVAGGAFFVVERDDAVAGFYRVMRQDGRASHVAALGTLAVAPAMRGTGLARAMIEEALARLKDVGVVRVELQVEADNPRGRAFYKKLGFVEEGVQQRAYRRAEPGYVDEIMMARFLDQE